MKTPDISVIILSFNTEDLTLACLRSVMDSQLGSLTMEVILVDNASSDATVKEVRAVFPSVNIIENKTNAGFAKGNNIGMHVAKGRYMLLLNSDTEVDPDAIRDVCIDMEKRPRAGAMTCTLVLTDGSMDPACHRGFPTPWASFTYFTKLEALFPKSTFFGAYHQGYKQMTVPHQVDAISGAFCMVRRETIEEVGYLDEAFFMYGEDLDWAYRMKEKGWEIWFDPDTTTLHRKKKSGRSHGDKKRRMVNDILFYDTMKLFYKKHYEKKYSWILTACIFGLLDMRIWMIKHSV